MGMSLGELSTPLEEIAPAKYVTASVPKPHSAFETYILEIPEKTGLAWVKAVGKALDTNSFGTQIISAFDAMEAKLANTYGRYERHDFLLPGSIWDEAQDWTNSLLRKERILISEWAPQHGSQLVDQLSSVALIASAEDASSGYIAIEYTFENHAAAEAEIAAMEDDAL
jgi:hypothetical protein